MHCAADPLTRCTVLLISEPGPAWFELRDFEVEIGTKSASTNQTEYRARILRTDAVQCAQQASVFSNMFEEIYNTSTLTAKQPVDVRILSGLRGESRQRMSDSSQTAEL